MFGRLVAAVGVFCVCAPATLLASADAPSPEAVSFAYALSHPVAPLPDAVVARTVEPDGSTFEYAAGDNFEHPPDKPHNPRLGPPRALSQNGVCATIASVAHTYRLPVPFFANLIWQESNFNPRDISRAGAQGIAQFMPKTAVDYGLINPFEPFHALNVSARFLRELFGQFGNLGLAAAAYNAGPRRVIAFAAKRGGLPAETRHYVARITGRPAESWTAADASRDPELTLMPAKAPCGEVTDAVAQQTKVVRVARLMRQLAAATAPPPPTVAEKPETAKLADAKTERATSERKSERGRKTARAGRSDDGDGRTHHKHGKSRLADDTPHRKSKRHAKVADEGPARHGKVSRTRFASSR